MTNKSKLIASFPRAFKSAYYEENGEDWDAHIKVDYDTARNPVRMTLWRMTRDYMNAHGITARNTKMFATRKGFHLRMWLRSEPGPYTALRLQAMLGDDPMRQRFNASRVRKRLNGWNVLWTKKFHNAKVTSEEVFDGTWTEKAEREFVRRNS